MRLSYHLGYSGQINQSARSERSYQHLWKDNGLAERLEKVSSEEKEWIREMVAPKVEELSIPKD